MLTDPPPAKFRRRPPRANPTPVNPPPAALVLVAAEYNHDTDRVVILTFDRAVDIGGLDGSQIIVDDGNDLGLKFRGNGGATLDDPATVRIVLTDDGDATGIETTLTAGAGNGIVASDDGGTWAGVSDLELPYP